MRPIKLGLLLAVAMVALPQTAFADTIRPAAPIVAVTVFQGQAEVTRRLEFDLAAGRHSLLIDNLPANLLAHSLRVAQGEGGSIEIGAIDLKREFDAEVARETVRRLQTEIEALSERVGEQDDVIKTRRLQLDFIAALGREIPKSLSAEGDGEKPSPMQDWRETWEMLGGGTQDALRDVRNAARRSRRMLRLREKRMFWKESRESSPRSRSIPIALPR